MQTAPLQIVNKTALRPVKQNSLEAIKHAAFKRRLGTHTIKTEPNVSVSALGRAIQESSYASRAQQEGEAGVQQDLTATASQRYGRDPDIPEVALAGNGKG